MTASWRCFRRTTPRPGRRGRWPGTASTPTCSSVERLFEVMHRHRWTTAYHFADGSAFEHAATLTHPVLPQADVHRRFPGIGVDAATAFERLWAERHTALIAGTPCPVPS